MIHSDDYLDVYPTSEQDALKQNELLREQIVAMRKEKENASRKYLPTLGELLDRLTITQIKEVKIPDHKEEYALEIKQILQDIESILSNDEVWFTGEMLRALIVLAQMNLHIWHNESNFRNGIKDGNDLSTTHTINGIRNTAKNIIQSAVGGRKDYKIDCLAASEHAVWEPSWTNKNEKK
jgi:hypothetical protein